MPELNDATVVLITRYTTLLNAFGFDAARVGGHSTYYPIITRAVNEKK